MTDEVAYASGEATPGRIVTIKYANRIRFVTTSRYGWWVFVAARVQGDEDKVPVVVDREYGDDTSDQWLMWHRRSLRDWLRWSRTSTRVAVQAGQRSVRYFTDVYEAQRRVVTPEHARLVASLSTDQPRSWAGQALLACLSHLRVSEITEAWCVAVIDAGVDGEWAFWVKYEYPYFDGEVGYRMTAADRSCHPGRFADQSYSDVATPPDPVLFGREAADFDIGEPLGNRVDHLCPDQQGIRWWGVLADGG